MKKTINYREKTISALRDWGYTKETATTFYNRAYTSALAEVKGRHKGMNVARELYASLFYQSANTFQLTDGQKVVLNPIYQNTSGNLSEAVLLTKMDKFFDKYKDSKFLKEAREDYASGKITRKTFNERIKVFKQVNVKYLISGS